ncbi:unnamed protein product [Lactuca virosa]|uniref:SWIM-type domain-containing protein n=1 Tax=Lactuca virosa TaxID=75947 RepID=A0AAU9NCD4_9ASTR|nr:unnamed protein product [Lactuca virosa]
MNRFGKNMRLWGIIHSQGHVFEARRGCDSYRVDLDDMTCSCRLWDLAGIPCVHANATINFIHQTPDAYSMHTSLKRNLGNVTQQTLNLLMAAIFGPKLSTLSHCLQCLGGCLAGSKRFRKNSIDVPRKKLCTRRGGGRISSAKTGNNTPTIGTQESVVQQVPVADEGENVMGENVMQEGYNVGQSVVQKVPTVVEKGVVQEEGVVQEVPVIHIQDGHMMQEGGTSQTSVMEGSDTYGQDVNDFIDGHDDVGLDGGAEGAGDESIGDGDGEVHGAGPDHGAGYEVVGDGDEEGHGGGDVDDGDGPEGDVDGPECGVEELGDDEENQGDDEGHEVVPMVRRTRKTSERITKIKLRKGVYDKDGGRSSSVKPIKLE